MSRRIGRWTGRKSSKPSARSFSKTSSMSSVHAERSIEPTDNGGVVRVTLDIPVRYSLLSRTVNRTTNRRGTMDQQRMKELIEQHVAAEMAGDTAGAVRVYTDDVEHDVIGSPTGPVHGPAAAQGFYDHLSADLDTEQMTPTREQYGENFCVVEHEATCVVKGAFMGVPGNGRRVTFRMLHVWDFKDDAISREQVWMDGGAIAAQLTAPQHGDVVAERASA